jgi:sec-independent protein translocase protein TatB
MFDFGFSEVLLTSVIALIVLGPEKLPRAASQVGRWVGRARAMARQFREQLEEEVNLENVKKAHKEEEARRETEAKRTGETAGANAAGGQSPSAGQDAASGPAAPAGQDSTAGQAAGTQGPTSAGQPASGVDAAHAESPYTQPAASPNTSFSSGISPDPPELRADTFSHAHPTNEFGANPLTANGAAEPSPPVESTPQSSSAPASHQYPDGEPAPGAPSAAPAEPRRAETGEAYASAIAPVPAPATEPPVSTHSMTSPEKSGPA